MAADFPADDGQLLDEDDLAGDLLGRERLCCIFAKFGLALLRVGGRPMGHDICSDEVAPALEVADADDGRPRDRRVPVEHALDVVGAESPAARGNDVFGAANEGEVPLLVDMRDVAGHVPVAEERRLRLLRKLPVAGEQRGGSATEGEITFDTVRQLVALVVDDRHVVAGKGAAARAGLHGTVREVRDDDVRLGLAVAVGDRHAPALLEDRDDLGVEEVAGRDEAPEARRAEALELRVLGERPVLAR